MDTLIRTPVIPLQARLDWLEAHRAFFPSSEAVERIAQLIVKDFSVDNSDADWKMTTEEHGAVCDELACRHMLHELQLCYAHELNGGPDPNIHMSGSTFAILHSLATWLGFDRGRR